MKSHQVNIDELVNTDVRYTLASQSGKTLNKRLYAVINLYDNTHYYEVYCGDNIKGKFHSLRYAVEAYNALQ